MSLFLFKVDCRFAVLFFESKTSEDILQAKCSCRYKEHSV